MPILCPILNKYGFSRQIFINGPYIKFYGNSHSGSRADRCEQTEGHDEAHRVYPKYANGQKMVNILNRQNSINYSLPLIY